MIEAWFIDYLCRDGSRCLGRVAGDRGEAVRTGGHVAGTFGHRPVFRWRVRARLPAVMAGHDSHSLLT